jgi:hypothetical protein
MDSESEKKAEAAFVSAVRVTESLMGRGNSGADKELARVLAKNILREELGAFEDPLKAIEPYDLGSGLIDHIQKMTMAAMAIADMKVWAQRSYRV